MLNLDLTLFLHSFVHHSPLFDYVVEFFARIVPWLVGGTYLYVVLLKYSRTVAPFLFSFLTLCVALVVSIILKHIFVFMRPFEMYGDIISPLFVVSDGGAFPSGHALVFSALITLGYFFTLRLRTPILVLSLLVALSRVIAGVHFVYDVIGGMVLGFSIAYIMIMLYKRRHARFR